MKSLLSACLVSLLSAVAWSEPQNGARNRAMGGTGVASADYLQAGFYNPALLSRIDMGTRFGFTVPSIGGLVRDENELLDTVDDFVDVFEELEDNFGSVTQPDLDALAADLLDLKGRTATIGVNAGLAVAIPSENLAIAVIIESYVDAQVFAVIDPADAAAISAALGGGILPNLRSAGVVLAAQVTEIGVALAHEFEVGGMSLAVGVTPKFQSIEAFNYSADVDDFDEDDFDDDDLRTDDSSINVDVGLALQANESLAIGIVGKNLIKQELDTITNTIGQAFTYTIAPVVTAGAAWKSGPLTLAVDVDLTKRERFGRDDETRFLHLGGEFGWTWGQLRLGFEQDLEDTVASLFTGGVGFSPFGVWHLDIGGAGGDNSYGFVIESSFTF